MAEPSNLRAALRLAWHGVRSRGRFPEDAATPRRRLAIERRGLTADPRRLKAYRRVTGAGDILDDPLLPPTYPALWETALAIELLVQAQLPFPTGGVVHLESEVVVLRSMEVGETVRCRVELERMEARPTGLKLTLTTRNWSSAGLLCRQGSVVLLLPGIRGLRGFASSSTAENATAAPDAVWHELDRWELKANHGRRYARVSGDYNPIHLWRWSARPFGFERQILHGFCLEAMIAQALIGRALGGSQSALRRLHTTFRSPVVLPVSVRLLTSGGNGSESGFFRLERAEGDGKTLAEGSYVGSPSPLPGGSGPVPERAIP
jgi:acyl dehydratase